MPVRMLKGIAKKAGTSLDHAEKIWDDSKKIASEKFSEGSPEFYPYLTGIVKRRLGVKSMFDPGEGSSEGSDDVEASADGVRDVFLNSDADGDDAIGDPHTSAVLSSELHAYMVYDRSEEAQVKREALLGEYATASGFDDMLQHEGQVTAGFRDHVEINSDYAIAEVARAYDFYNRIHQRNGCSDDE